MRGELGDMPGAGGAGAWAAGRGKAERWEGAHWPHKGLGGRGKKHGLCPEEGQGQNRRRVLYEEVTSDLHFRNVTLVSK